MALAKTKYHRGLFGAVDFKYFVVVCFSIENARMGVFELLMLWVAIAYTIAISGVSKPAAYLLGSISRG